MALSPFMTISKRSEVVPDFRLQLTSTSWIIHGRDEPSHIVLRSKGFMMRDALRDVRCTGINDKDVIITISTHKQDLGSHLYFIKDISVSDYILYRTNCHLL